MNSINFINTDTDLNHLYIYATGSLYCPYDFLKYFPNLRTLKLYFVRFDRFPLFNSTRLISLCLLYLTLPNIVTIQPPMLFLPNLDFIELYQTEFQEWFLLSPVVSIAPLLVLYSCLVCNISTVISSQSTSDAIIFVRFLHKLTFEENVLSGLDTLTYLDFRYSQTNIDFPINDTFPNLTKLYLFYTATTTLYQIFFERQKALSIIYNMLHMVTNSTVILEWLGLATWLLS